MVTTSGIGRIALKGRMTAIKTPRDLKFSTQKSEIFSNILSGLFFYLLIIKYIAKNIFGFMKTYSYLLDVIEK
ncbi:MAG: hypothetical protein Q8S01_02300, partial [Ignavibacteria bacterium]|nr:hypothetical protein [Ignavibacteria bacterium]